MLGGVVVESGEVVVESGIVEFGIVVVESGVVVVESGIVIVESGVVVVESGIVVVESGATGSVLLVVAGASVALGFVAQAPRAITETKASGMASILSFMVCVSF